MTNSRNSTGSPSVRKTIIKGRSSLAGREASTWRKASSRVKAGVASRSALVNWMSLTGVSPIGVEVRAAVTTICWLVGAGSSTISRCTGAPEAALHDCCTGLRPGAVTTIVPEEPGTFSKANSPAEVVVVLAE